jgi:hypothetical protein
MASSRRNPNNLSITIPDKDEEDYFITNEEPIQKSNEDYYYDNNRKPQPITNSRITYKDNKTGESQVNPYSTSVYDNVRHTKVVNSSRANRPARSGGKKRKSLHKKINLKNKRKSRKKSKKHNKK